MCFIGIMDSTPELSCDFHHNTIISRFLSPKRATG
jgi:hypothetical protein